MRPLRASTGVFPARYAIALVLFSVAYIAFALARGEAQGPNGKTTELYALSARGLLSGHTHLALEPDPAFLALPNPYDPAANGPYRLHDAAYYHGHYYLYHGVVPVIGLFLPYRLLTGRDLTNRIAVPVLCILGLLFSCMAFRAVCRNQEWVCPAWLEWLVLLSLGGTTLVCFLLRRPSFYEVAIAGGYCCVMAGFAFLCSAFAGPVLRPVWLMLAGLSFGLAAGCRPTLAFIAVLMIGIVAVRMRRDLRAIAFFSIPIFICGLLLAIYNFLRFHNPLEFGMSYQVTNYASSWSRIELPHMWQAMVHFLFLPPAVDSEFPFLHPAMVNLWLSHPAADQWSYEPIVGVFWGVPLTLLAIMGPWILIKTRVREHVKAGTGWIIHSAIWAAVLILLALFSMPWASGRYMVDFTPLLVLSGCLVLVGLWQQYQTQPRSARRFRWLATVAVLYGLVANLAFVTPRLGTILHRIH